MMKAVIVAPGQGKFVALGPGGPGITIKLGAAETGGLCTVTEGRLGSGMMGAGPHFHRECDEFFYVLDGELMFRTGEDSHIARAGTFAFVPRGTVHGFHNAGSQSAAILVVHYPSGFESFVEELGQLAARNAGREERAALAVRFDIIPADQSTKA